MLCPACKTPVPPSARTCPACGTPAPADDRTAILESAPPDEGEGDTQLRPGTAFGARYRIDKLLGEGGMGAVYKAYDTELGRTVAIKLVRKELATSRQIMQRFKQELLLASKISHKNILRIHDLGEIDGIKFITMAFVEGTDLAGLIEQTGRLPLGPGVEVRQAIMRGLGSGAQRRRSASRPEAAEHSDRRGRSAVCFRLRAGQVAGAGSDGDDAGRAGAGDAALHVAGTSGSQGYRPAQRFIFAGPDLLRDVHGGAAVPGRVQLCS